MIQYYILKDKEPVPATITEWSDFFRVDENRLVDLTEFKDVSVSTVFLGINHNFQNIGAPILFETMIFGSSLDGEMLRYETWGHAEAGHIIMVRRVLLETESEESSVVKTSPNMRIIRL